MTLAELNRSSLEPVDLGALADAMHAERWLDVRVVEMGTLQRVQIQQINVHRTRDEVVLTQKWPFGDEVRSDSYTVDAEDVRWVEPSAVELADVAPFRRPSQPCDDPDAQIVQLVGCAAFVYRVSASAIFTKVSPDPGLRARQACMWAIYETTDMDPRDIAKRFGYKSQMPMQTTSEKVLGWAHQGGNVDHDFRRAVADLVELAEDKGGHRYRRQEERPWPTML